MRKFILASGSPRRSEILKMLGFEFTVKVPKGEESADWSQGIAGAVERLAERKAREISDGAAGCVVLGSDTVVEIDGRVLGKPESARQARDMLRCLSGREHRVYTAVCVTDGERTESVCCVTNVEFYDLRDDTVESYIKTGEPFDKAGAYGIQGLGAALVRRIDGDFYTVMGLPARVSAEMLGHFGVFSVK